VVDADSLLEPPELSDDESDFPFEEESDFPFEEVDADPPPDESESPEAGLRPAPVEAAARESVL
jgi:hypothetical protein